MNTSKKLIAATIVLGTLFGNATMAFAADNSTSSNTTTQVTSNSTTVTATNSTGTGTNDTNSTDSNSTSGNSTDGNTTDTNSTDVNSTNSTGTTDATGITSTYFSFVSAVTQSIEVALANNDLQKAQLLAQFGAEQIQQANQLIAAGQTDAANQLLTQALSDQTLAVDTASTSTTPQATQVNGFVSGNLNALATALTQVQNPRAQQALEKNIAKAFNHLQKRLGKGGHGLLPVVTTTVSTSGSDSTGTNTTGSDNSTSTNSTASTDNSTNTSGTSTNLTSNVMGSLTTSLTSQNQGNSGSTHGQSGQHNNQGKGHGHH